MSDEPSRSEENPVQPVNFFRPKGGYMRREVILTAILLCAWALLTFGFQSLLFFTAETTEGGGPLTATTLFGFPLHFLFTGQFLIVCFIVLCYLFNVFIDRLTRTRKRR